MILSIERRYRAVALTASTATQTEYLEGTGPNQVWAYDFIHDRCGNGQALKILTVVDEWTRECLAIEAGSSLDAARVIAVLPKGVTVFKTGRDLLDNVRTAEGMVEFKEAIELDPDFALAHAGGNATFPRRAELLKGSSSPWRGLLLLMAG